MPNAPVPFNTAGFHGRELAYLEKAISNGHLSGNGPFTHLAEGYLTELHLGARALLTTSCTHALEMAARILDLQPSDEVIVPAYTFVSTASAFVWNGARPVFADIRPDTLNIDPDHVQALITPRTKAVCIVHYAGVGADPDVFAAIAKERGIHLIEDNAHGLGGKFGGQVLGTFGSMSTLSFHETKNVTCGEGGAIVFNDPSLVRHGEILREKGTNRAEFMQGLVDKYTWVDVGSSWVLSDLLAGILAAQLEQIELLNSTRLALWSTYEASLTDWASHNAVGLPAVPAQAEHVGHMFHLRLPEPESRPRFISHMRSQGIDAVFHYQSLDESPAGIRHGKIVDACTNSRWAARTVVRLPMYATLGGAAQERVIEAVQSFEA